MAKVKWRPTSGPGLRAGWVESWQASEARFRAAAASERFGARAARMLAEAGYADTRFAADLVASPAWAETMRQAARAVDALRSAPITWVSAQMAALALDASHDVPDWDPSVAPDPSGWILLDKPLPAVRPPDPLRLRDGTDWHGEAPVWGLSWYTGPGGRFEIGILTRLHELPAPINDGELQEILDLIGGPEVVALGHGPDSGILAWLTSAWQLMDIPTLAERRTIDVRTGAAPGPGTRPDLTVRTVTLRRLRHVDTGEEVDARTGRRYQYRWIVRGHWRHVAYGPGRSLRRRTFIEPYTKGPADAPFLAQEKVRVWRR